MTAKLSLRNRKRLKRITPYRIVIISLLMMTVCINIIAWNSVVLSDWYRENIFVLWGPLYGLVTGRTERSVGEMMLGVAVILTLVAVIFGIAFIMKIGRISAGIPVMYLKYYLLLVCIVALVQTLNCFVLYHTSTFEEQYVSEYLQDKGDRVYTIEELGALRDIVVSRANELALTLPRDKAGDILYDKDMATEAVKSMKALGDTYDGLSGYYTRPKALYTSEFFSQQYIMGYYFPFSMEANYNDVMYIANIPATMCHELAHTKGYISEDEANLIGFLACIHSDDDFFRYSGYLSVLGYINNDLISSIKAEVAADYGLDITKQTDVTRADLEAGGIDVDEYNSRVRDTYDTYVMISDEVIHDRVFLTKEAWNEVESNAIIDTETVHKASDAFINTNLKANGVSEGDAVYSEVVALLMDFYVYNIDVELQ